MTCLRPLESVQRPCIPAWGWSLASAPWFLRMLIPSAAGELIMFGILAWLLTEWNIRQIEKKVGEV
ncbi:hypothetical protein AALD74_00590 [Lachnospiraceae bacterium 48-21]